jgi:DNA-directed RNA polymerase subunit RPC12/RpoP
MFRSRLAAEGVPAVVNHEYHIGNAWHYSTALGGVRVQVPAERKEDADSVAWRCRVGEFNKTLENQFGVMDEIRCPNCGSGDYRRRRPIPRAVISLMVSFLTGVVFPPAGWIYICSRCEAKFRRTLAPLTYTKVATILMANALAFVVLLAAALCVWSISTKYWFVTVLIEVMLVGLWKGLRTGNTPVD